MVSGATCDANPSGNVQHDSFFSPPVFTSEAIEINCPENDDACPCLPRQAAKLFAVMLKRNKTLRHLDLARNALGSQAGVALAGALRVNQTLAFLSLAGNAMGAKAAKALAHGFAENVTLTAADLSCNAFGVSMAEGGDAEDVGLLLGHGLRRYRSSGCG